MELGDNWQFWHLLMSQMHAIGKLMTSFDDKWIKWKQTSLQLRHFFLYCFFLTNWQKNLQIYKMWMLLFYRSCTAVTWSCWFQRQPSWQLQPKRSHPPRPQNGVPGEPSLQRPNNPTGWQQMAVVSVAKHTNTNVTNNTAHNNLLFILQGDLIQSISILYDET